MTQSHQANVDLSQMDLSDWRKRIHQLKQELKANNATTSNPLLANQLSLSGPQALSKPTRQRVTST